MLPTLNYFLIFIFVKHNFSGVNKCVFKCTCARDRPFSFPYPLKICVALLRTVLIPLPRGDHGRRLKVVMVEGFPLFGTMAFVICCVQHSWFGCRVGSDVVVVNILPQGSMTIQSKTRNDVHLLL